MSDIIIPTPVESAMPPPPPPPIAPRTPGSSKAVIALILGILSLMCCGFFSGIPAIIMGKAEMKAVDAGLSDPNNRTLALVGFILGIIGTILSLLSLIIYAIIVIMAVMAGKSVPTTF